MKHRAPIIAGIIGVAVLALIVLFVVSPKGDDTQVTSPLLGKIAPVLTGTTMSGDPFDLDSLRGEWVLVNFFGTWCAPCVLEHPELVQLAADGQVQVVSVAFDDSAENVEKFFAEKGGTWPVLTTDTGGIALDYGVKGLPESFLIAPDGKVVAKYEGGIVAKGENGLEQYLAQLTGKAARS